MLRQRANWTTALCHINGDARGRKITLEQICEHFEQKELRSGDSFRSFAMVKTYRGYLRKWIKPRCGPPYPGRNQGRDVEAWVRRHPTLAYALVEWRV
jgi:hypothetical protein